MKKKLSMAFFDLLSYYLFYMILTVGLFQKHHEQSGALYDYPAYAIDKIFRKFVEHLQYNG